MGFKSMLMSQMLKRQMKDVPKEQQDQVLKAIENNPELFQKIAKEIQSKGGSGKDQMSVAMEVMQKYQGELREAMGK